MKILKEMKKKIQSVFSREKEKKLKAQSNSSSIEDTLNPEEIEKLSGYSPPRQTSPENRDISPY